MRCMGATCVSEDLRRDVGGKAQRDIIVVTVLLVVGFVFTGAKRFVILELLLYLPRNLVVGKSYPQRIRHYYTKADQTISKSYLD